MDLAKSSLVEISGGVFIGKLVDFFFSNISANTNSLTAGSVPKIFVEIVAETALIAYLSQQFMNWEWRNGYGGNQDLGKLFFALGIYVSSTNYLKKIRLLAAWIQSWSGKEFSSFTSALQNQTTLSNPMLTTKEPKGIFDTAVTPTDSSMRDINFQNPQNI